MSRTAPSTLFCYRVFQQFPIPGKDFPAKSQLKPEFALLSISVCPTVRYASMGRLSDGTALKMNYGCFQQGKALRKVLRCTNISPQ